MKDFLVCEACSYTSGDNLEFVSINLKGDMHIACRDCYKLIRAERNRQESILEDNMTGFIFIMLDNHNSNP